MKAMIFAAGLGTRLKPITDKIPKALVSVGGIPILELVIKKLQKEGFDEFIINVHYFSEQIVDFLKKNNNFGSIIHISDETQKLLDTGGGLLNAEKFLSGTEDFLICNVDILTDIDIKTLFDTHRKNNALATLAMTKRESTRRLVFDSQNRLCYWENTKTGEIKPAKSPIGDTIHSAFAGIQVISPKIFDKINLKGKFSIIDLYLQLANDNKICSAEFEPKYWFDIGSVEKLKKAERFMKRIT